MSNKTKWWGDEEEMDDIARGDYDPSVIERKLDNGELDPNEAAMLQGYQDDYEEGSVDFDDAS